MLRTLRRRAKKPRMYIARTRADLEEAVAAVRRARGGVALVPTMGALHDGHLALLGVAREAAPGVAASIFVNPTQFAPNEDFARYPREESADLEKLRHAGCDLVWLPTVAEMYPPGDATMVEVAGPALGWEGTKRPGHFRGVATVVTKLFGQVRPDAAVFGEKDWQQLQVIHRIAADLALPVRIVGATIVREVDGLAMSSRNRFLTQAERAVAPALHARLQDMRGAMANGAASADTLRDGRHVLAEQGFSVDYLALVDGAALLETDRAAPSARLIAAAQLGSVRLLDNIAAA
jgi:pantoate--beta-alanine ligase